MWGRWKACEGDCPEAVTLWASLPCLTFNIPATSIPNVTQPVTHQCKADGNGHWEWVDTNSDFVESMATNLESQFHRLLAVIKELFNLLEAPLSSVIHGK